MSNTYIHREAWLHAVAVKLSPVFSDHGSRIPFKVRITCGFPSRRPMNGQKNQRIGECWYAEASTDNTIEIMISPVMDDPIRVAGILTHELIHAAVGPDVGHKGPFRKLAKKLGLEGKMTATTEGEAFKQLIAPILEEVGPYPHAKLNARARSSGPKKQTTRMIKCECLDCGYTARTSQKWLDEMGAPHCPEHGPMEVM